MRDKKRRRTRLLVGHVALVSLAIDGDAAKISVRRNMGEERGKEEDKKAQEIHG